MGVFLFIKGFCFRCGKEGTRWTKTMSGANTQLALICNGLIPSGRGKFIVTQCASQETREKYAK